MEEPSNPNESGEIAVTALRRKRAEIAGRISDTERLAERLRTELVHIDAVLRMFRPGLVPEAIPPRLHRPTRSPYFKHGELTQRIYSAMRDGGEVYSADIAAVAMRDKGLDPTSDPATRSDFVRRVGLQLNTLQRKGKIERLGKGRALRWRLASEV